MTASDAALAGNPLLTRGRRPSAFRPSRASRRSITSPAFDTALAEQQAEIAAIAGNAEAPTFANTIEALETKRRGRSSGSAACSSTSRARTPTMRSRRSSARWRRVLAKHRNSIFMNEALFRARRRRSTSKRDSLGLTPEQARVLDRYHTIFVRAGAQLGAGGEEASRRDHGAAREPRHAVLAERAGRREILSARSRRRGGSRRPAVLPARGRGPGGGGARPEGQARHHALPLQHRALPAILQAGATCASRPSRPGRRAATTATPPTTRRSSPRWWPCAPSGRSFSATRPSPISSSPTRWRRRPATCSKLLNEVWTPARARAEGERDDLQAQAQSQRRQHRHRAVGLALLCRSGAHGAPQSRRGDDQALLPARPHHRGCLRNGATALRPELRGAEGFPALSSRYPRLAGDGCATASPVGIFIGDYFARPSKRSGAWMSAFRSQEKLAGDIRPIIVNVMNFSKGAAGEPSLLSFDDARTLFHEFGHAPARPALERDLSAAGRHEPCRRISSSCRRSSTSTGSRSRTSCAATRPITGPASRFPEALLERLMAARNFNQGFATVEYLASAFVDHRASPPQGSERSRRVGLREGNPARRSACRARSSCATARRISRMCSRATAIRRAITAISGRRCSTRMPSPPSRRRATPSTRTWRTS